MTFSWFILSTLNYDAQSTTHQPFLYFLLAVWLNWLRLSSSQYCGHYLWANIRLPHVRSLWNDAAFPDWTVLNESYVQNLVNRHRSIVYILIQCVVFFRKGPLPLPQRAESEIHCPLYNISPYLCIFVSVGTVTCVLVETLVWKFTLMGISLSCYIFQHMCMKLKFCKKCDEPLKKTHTLYKADKRHPSSLHYIAMMRWTANHRHKGARNSLRTINRPVTTSMLKVKVKHKVVSVHVIKAYRD